MEAANFHAQGKDWNIALTVGLLEDLRAQTGVDLPVSAERVESWYNLLYDPVTLGQVLEVLCDGLDRRALTGDELADGWAASLDAIINFTPPAMRATMKTTIANLTENQEKLLAAAEEMVNLPEYRERVDAEIEAAKGELLRSIGGSNATD